MGLLEELTALGIPIPREFPVDQWVGALGEKPSRNTLSLIGLSTLLFYMAERDHNPRVNDIWDSLIYCSTCVSVGYADIFPRTPIGKILGSALMTLGPAIVPRTLEGPADQRHDEKQEQILQTLRQILAELQSRPPEGT